MASIAAEHYAGESPGGQPEWEYIQASLAEFRKEHCDMQGSRLRGPLALTLVDNLRSAVTLPESSSDVWQLRSKTQLDAVEWLSWNDIWYYANDTVVRDPYDAEPKNVRGEEFLAKERLFQDIEQYGILSDGTDGTEAYQELLDSIYLARLVVKNPSGLLEADKSIDAVALGQQLAVHRTVKALHYSGFSKTRRSSMKERDKKVHVVIPIGRGEKRAIKICLQPGSGKTGSVDVQPMKTRRESLNAFMFVNVPYNTNGHSPFVMMEEDRQTLSDATKYLRGNLMPFNPGFEVQAV